MGMCNICGEGVPQERVDFLLENGDEVTCISCASLSVKRKMLVDFGEDGVDTKICDSVEDCSLSSIFGDDGDSDQE